MDQLSLRAAMAEPVLWSPRAAAPESTCLRACAPQQEKLLQWDPDPVHHNQREASARRSQREASVHHNQREPVQKGRPSTA